MNDFTYKDEHTDIKTKDNAVNADVKNLDVTEHIEKTSITGSFSKTAKDLINALAEEQQQSKATKNAKKALKKANKENISEGNGKDTTPAERQKNELRQEKEISAVKPPERNITDKVSAVEKAKSIGLKLPTSETVKESFLTMSNSRNAISTNASNSVRSLITTSRANLDTEITEKDDDISENTGFETLITVYEGAKEAEGYAAAFDKYKNNNAEKNKNIKAKDKNALVKVQKQNLRRSYTNRQRESYTENFAKHRKKTALRSQAKKKTRELAAKAVVGSRGVLIVFLPVFLIIVCMGAVAGVICCFTWQTSCDMDTTEIIKYISKKDRETQSKWYGLDNNVLTLAQKNDDSKKYYKTYYLIAVDVPYDTEELDAEGKPLTTNCMVKAHATKEGSSAPTYSGCFKIKCSTPEEMLENYRWTTDDYFAALAYLQVKNENIGWFGKTWGFVGDGIIKSSVDTLFTASTSGKIVYGYKNADDDFYEYSYQDPIFSYTARNDNGKTNYYFGKKYTVNYLIENDIVRFDDDDVKNEQMKTQYRNVLKYGNLGVACLTAPVELDDDEKIADRIVKHFGEQFYLKFKPSTPLEKGKTSYNGSIAKVNGKHYAIDIKADEGDNIIAPISGMCTVKQCEGRGFEYTISTGFDENGQKFDAIGYVIKISGSGGSYLSLDTPTFVSAGDYLGTVCELGVGSINYEIPKFTDIDTDPEDIGVANRFPCFTGTDFQSIDGDQFTCPDVNYNYIHMEMYKTPCDFTNADDIEKNTLDPELFFIREEDNT